ncbi:FadR/GntR family transcriptional regulator [Thalassospira sp.]|uniref:FadR/GntR family transcriptional regulator n=1 Tax=Thalassospira sp. TaxID=1912094 RepID=UPI003AA99597
MKRPDPFRKKMTRTETVTAQLKNHISQANLQPGDALPKEKELCAQFNASRTVIREALATLKADGMVVAKHGVGFFVASPAIVPCDEPSGFDLGDLSNVSSVLNVLELRKGVEAEAAALAALRRSPAQHAHIQECFEKLKAALQTEQADSSLPDYQFHQAIAKATNNPVYVSFLEYVIETAMAQAFEIGYGANESRRLDRIDILLDEHWQIVEAISEQSPDKARMAMHDHLEKSAARFGMMDRYKGV